MPNHPTMGLHGQPHRPQAATVIRYFSFITAKVTVRAAPVVAVPNGELAHALPSLPPSGELALKELLYDEIFLASATECSTPL